jgi:hypothetical protein
MDVKTVNKERSGSSRTGWSKTFDRAPESEPRCVLGIDDDISGQCIACQSQWDGHCTLIISKYANRHETL